MAEELGTPHTILAAQAAAGAVTDLLQHHRNGGQGRFGGEVIESLTEALVFAIDIEIAGIRVTKPGSEMVAQLMKDEISELGQLRAAIRKWEGRA